MSDKVVRTPSRDVDPDETLEWLESLDYALENYGPDRVRFLLKKLEEWTQTEGVEVPFSANTAYVNSIPADQQPPYPGNREIERRIKSIIRWNAMAMVVRANREYDGIGGHISTYASAATLIEVGFDHFFRGKGEDFSGDQVYFQGHASPGIYARAFLEGRLDQEHLENFRREFREPGGLSSYPHPWLMPDFWEYPTVSMGLAPIMGIYHARFNRYLEDRGIQNTSGSNVWVFLGDGETDEPESLGAITLASREKLDNLIFVINCNLQRLDGPVRGNGKIIQELEAAFRGAGWNVLKVLWGNEWDPLLAEDHEGLLVQRMGEVVDGQYQKYTVSSGDFIRENFFGKNPKLLKLVEKLSDEHLHKIRRGGHDPEKVYAAYKAAVEHKGAPTVILAKTIKGYGMGEAGEGRNVSHQQKKLNEDELREFRTRFGIPISDDEVAQAPFYRPPDDSPEIQYMKQRREELGGYLPSRELRADPIQAPSLQDLEEFLVGTKGREASTTMAFARMFGKLLRDPTIGQLIVPIIPDEARTFGMEPLFRQCGIYSHVGQLYEPVDADTLLYYREVKDGQILEEGINEAGAMASFIAAGTAYASHGVNTIPFFIYYSMFGFQRIGDLIWAAADMRCKGFLLGGTAGRTTLSGEGLQHEDGHSHVLASTIPNMLAYDPAFAYEIAVIVQDGIRRMYENQEDIFYYLTLGNEPYPMPALPEGSEEGILKGIYKVSVGAALDSRLKVQLFGSGSILIEALRAQEILAEQFAVSADVWSVTSYKELRREALEVDRWNRLHPAAPPKKAYIASVLEGSEGPIVAASDYMKILPDMIRPWTGNPFVSLGTDGFGRSDTREALRRHFEVDAESIALAALHALSSQGKLAKEEAEKAIGSLGIDPEKADPVSCGPATSYSKMEAEKK
ncbi:MAG TPA: pyruvate dehydrogenase (acetyl-transferring), homodimeric type [Candidatus Latescibacteria bacterium]|nr:pyruvate dehydrogenase (acetyl-transferring), homodimeric type [Gemmatimonadota bacterium]HCR18777.1 pyruvate dehydrogenase (acetyl-transferring), homodimeric type [Candidatus Latescibacterota bacterium]